MGHASYKQGVSRNSIDGISNDTTVTNESVGIANDESSSHTEGKPLMRTNIIHDVSRVPSAIERCIDKSHVDDDTPILVIMCGTPASGKSTVRTAISRARIGKRVPVVVCPDDIRKVINGNEADQSNGKEVWRCAYGDLDNALDMTGVIVTFDATSSHVRDRKALSEAGRKRGAVIVTVWCDTPLESCLARNDSRDRHVPREVITRMYRSIADNPPTRDEDGVSDFLIVLRPRESLGDVRVRTRK